jgi:6-phosphogluconolactonase (cycloisomerase 2 family)
VRTQPTGNRCTVANGEGTIAADVNNIVVTCTPTQSGTLGYAMVANSSSNNFSLYSRVSPSGGLNTIGTTAVGATPSAVAIAPNGVFAYTADKFSDRISAFNVVDPGAGSYQATPVGTASVSGPTAIAVEPGTGRFLWALSEVSPGKITTFQVSAANGALSQPVPTSTNAFCSALVVHPTGKFVYVACPLSQTLFLYSADGSTGALTQIGSLGQTVASGGHMVVSPDGKFLFLLSATSIRRFSVDTTTGQLTSLGTTSVSGASGASDIAIRPTGNFLYVSADSSLGGFIRPYAIDANGGLTAATEVALPSRTTASLALDATGSFLYAALFTPGSVTTYQVDGNTGALTQIDSDATGSQPLDIAVTP